MSPIFKNQKYILKNFFYYKSFYIMNFYMEKFFEKPTF